MSEWPEGWFRGTPGSGGAPGEAGAGDPTEQLPAGSRAPAPRSPAPHSPAPRSSGSPSPGSSWPAQPPADSSGRGAPGRGGVAVPSRPAPAGPPGQYPPGPARPGPARGVPGTPGPARSGGGWGWPRRVLVGVAALVALVLVGSVIMYVTLNGKLHRKDVLVAYAGMPAQGSGTNWLIAGSDSRQGLTSAQERKYATGFDVGGGRSDTIMVLHVSSTGGPPVLISIPRDSWVNIPGHGDNKINAAYSFGGARLMTKTVQQATGLRIDHYMGIGFGGFVSVVNAVGGVRMHIKYPLHDVASGLNISKGWHTLNGGQALGYVRDRHDFSNQDLQRVQDQRLLLKALLSKLTSPSTLLNPFAVIPAASGAAGTLTVDKGTSLLQLARVAFALRSPETTTVPIADSNYQTPTGESAVEWDQAQAQELFRALNDGKRVPRSLITGSHEAS